jgi:hypothetical protein
MREGPTQLDTSVEVLDNWAHLRRTLRGQLGFAIGGAAVGLAMIISGLVLLPRLPGYDRTTFQGPAGLYYSMVGFGAALLVIGLLGASQRRKLVVEVTISDDCVQLKSRDGSEQSVRWSDNPLYVRLWHAVEHPPGTAVHVEGRMLEWGRVRCPVSDEIVSALERRARRLGLDVSRTQEKFSFRGPPSILEVIEFRGAPPVAT